ncbi:MAG: hypothetical protein K0Q63_162 [Paenibacillus sp.]|jgi:hypothetical protein|nr:hypothetical protein [Paenibacillus sp.]
MERIYPLSDDHLQHIIGMPVCAVMKNGFRYVGIAESCKGGRLELSDPASRAFRFRSGQHNEQNATSERTVNNDNKKSVRGKKQHRQAKASSASQEAVSTNYASNGHNPAANARSHADFNGSKLDLDDIFLLFLII